MEEENDALKQFNEENEKFVSMITNKSIFSLVISEDSVVPITNPNYYKNRKSIILEKNISYNQVMESEIEIEKEKYSTDNIDFDKIIEYVNNNLNKLFEIANNQSKEMYEGGGHNINIKIGSVYLMISYDNIRDEETLAFLEQFEKNIISILVSNNQVIAYL